MTRVRFLLHTLSAGLVLACAVDAATAGSERAGARKPNHLLGETSPYLLQHLYNPVDWYPWGEEALGRARREDRPIFLSVGYSACHWCHVMEREAFSDEGIARLLNDRFVAIKVDREERPDLDDIYMDAVVAMTGRGGWPMSVFLTPDRKPFHGGTYFPKDRFRDLLQAIDEAWRSRRAEVMAAADRVTAMAESGNRTSPPRATVDLGPGLLKSAISSLRADFDPVHGGFGGAPKFPPHGALSLLLRAQRAGSDREALDMAVRTLDAMARGGMYDQIGGGFHRYSTDARWFAPHFEKMLYDNALLAPVYFEAWRQTGREDFLRVGRETLAWVGREMTHRQGGFYSTLDADSEGEEGRFYLWTTAGVRQEVGADDAGLVIAYFGMEEKGNFHGGRNILHVPVPPEDFARDRGLGAAALRERIDAARRRLLQARSRRARPHLDDKVLTAWNGPMISAFARAYGATGEEAYRSAAARAARFVLEHLAGPRGGLLVAWRNGRANLPAYLDDSAFLARGLLDLHDATGEERWLREAARIVKEADRFLDRETGGYYFTAPEHRDLILRPKDLADSALPSGNAIMAECLFRLWRALGDEAHRAAATRTLDLAGPSLRDLPESHAYMVLASGFAGGGAAPAPVVARARRAGKSLTGGEAIAAESAPAAPDIRPAVAAAPGARPGGKDRVVKGTIVGRPNPQRVVESAVSVPAAAVRPGQALTLSLRLDIRPGWHVNSSIPTLEYLIPTRLEFPEPAAAAVEEVAYPQAKMVPLKFAGEKLAVYEGTAIIRATVRPPVDSPRGPREVRSRLVYQACSDTTCLAPETVEFLIPILVEGEPILASGPTSPRVETGEAMEKGGGVAGLGGESRVADVLAESGMLVLLGLVFLGGLALNLTPCVYPMMPVTIGFFATQAAGGWGRRVALPSLYVLGMALTYSVLGAVAGLSGGLIGSTLQNPWVVGGLVVLFVVMALSMFGLFDLRLPGSITRLGGGRRGPIGALVMGLTIGLVAAPCIGPFVVGLLAFVSASGNPALGFWLFFVMALGMGLPNLVLGIFSSALSSLPRSGEWLVYAKKVMGVGLLAVALYFVQPFLSDRALGWTALVFACAAGIYLALLERTRLAARWFLPLKVALGVAIVLCGAWLSLPLVQARPELEWAPYSHDAFAGALASDPGRPVIIDFSADWCLPCRELERYTFTDAAVIEEAARFALLKADLTEFESEHVRQMRERFDVIGVPTIVFIDNRGEERKDLRVYGFEAAESFLARMRQVR
jgi:uncharacterized protein YyaL (SSP411 family)/cytochrome c biogenesis protein CcdA